MIPITRGELKKLLKETCPLDILSVTIKRNIIGVPEVSVRMKNRSRSGVVAIEVTVECWNRFDEKVMDWAGKTNVFRGLGQTTIARGKERSLSWQLVGHGNTAKVKVKLVRVKSASGVEWKAKNGKNTPSARAQITD